MKPIINRLSGSTLFIFFPVLFFIRKKMTGKIIVFFIALTILPGCFQHYFRTATSKTIDAATIKKLQNASKYFVLHAGINVMALNNVSISNDKIEGDIAELSDSHSKYINPAINKANPVVKKDKALTLMEVHLYYTDTMPAVLTHIAIPLSALNRMDVYEFDASATNRNRLLSWLGVGAGIAAAGLIVLAIACNCPQVYVNNAGQYEFKSGVYSGAIYSSLERVDYLPLADIKPVNKTYQLRIDNAAEEEQFINQVQLLSVVHSGDVKVLTNRQGKILSYRNLIPASATKSDDAVDVTKQIKYRDGQNYSFSNNANSNGLSSVSMSFDKPAGATKGKLLVHAGNSKWSGYLYREFASLFGTDYDKWRKQQELGSAATAQQWPLDQGMPLKVFVSTDNGWEYIDHFALTGNTASRDMIMEIDLTKVRTGKVNIRIETIYQFWDLDMAAMDFSTDADLKTTILNPLIAAKKDGSSLLNELSLPDKQYATLTGDDFLNIEFAAPQDEKGKSNSLFLVSSGYYHNLKKFDGQPDINSLLKFKENGAFDRFSRQKYTTIEEALAKAVVK